jgi:hypothetical protein
VPLDVLASARSTALIALVTASFSTPIVAKSDAFANIAGKDGGSTVATEQLVAGGVEFALPEDWGRLGPSAAAGSASERIGTVVSGVCPGGSAGAECVDGTQVTFIAYTGDKGHELPDLDAFGSQLDARLSSQFPGYRKLESKVKTAAGGMRWLDYSFTWRSKGQTVTQRFAAYRHKGGSGVVAMVAGDGTDHAKALDSFLASGHPLGEA